MWRRLQALMVAVVLGISMLAAPARAQAPVEAYGAVPGECVRGSLPHGAISLICVPASGWNGSLVLWGHGYIAFNAPLDVQHLQLPDGSSLPDLVQSLGFAFATTSYRQNGLAILEGVDDMRELIAAFRQAHGAPVHTYMVGASEGGIITTLLQERSPELISGALAMCGPIGNFREQIAYYGDFRVLFDYFFPGVLPGSPIAIPNEVIAGWESIYVPAIKQALAANPAAAKQLIATSKAAIDHSDPSTIETTTLSLLWYSVFATNDGSAKLGGNPYDNRSRVYFGSSNDFRLNLRVARFRADPAAVAAMQAYETSGRVTRPLIVLHTTGDQIIPIWHEVLYTIKARPSGQGHLTPVPILRYGHCNFTATEMLGAFGLLVLQVTGSAPPNAPVLALPQGATLPQAMPAETTR
jgi:pimeloyl-ACP methyl ester carboxylesterase